MMNIGNASADEYAERAALINCTRTVKLPDVATARKKDLCVQQALTAASDNQWKHFLKDVRSCDLTALWHVLEELTA
ncbi:hypothetical protein NDU88_007070 [Pleurodeles waltl]|uniref:Uncharacterized protein n=1 Tax=Pleurodeles waltl TaxID=8319 RepID=A0AAV7WCE0_PLEWA|nr:hypothetical protein NDU88_007070 [Pleurodeles waltl]